MSQTAVQKCSKSSQKVLKKSLEVALNLVADTVLMAQIYGKEGKISDVADW